MSHGLDNCVPVLRRWAAISDQPLPTSWAEFERSGMAQAFDIERRDPELVSLLRGTASAALRADALVGVMPEVALSEAERAEAALQEQIRQLTASNPYGKAGRYEVDGTFVEPQPGNLTAAMQLEAIAPEVAARLKKEAQPAAAPTGLSQEAANWVNQEAMRMRQESMVMAQQAALANGGVI